MSRYAQNTEVPVDRSRAEIEKILLRYGAHAFAYATENNRAMISFKANKRMIRFISRCPRWMNSGDAQRGRRDRSDSGYAYSHWEKGCRQSGAPWHW